MTNEQTEKILKEARKYCIDKYYGNSDIMSFLDDVLLKAIALAFAEKDKEFSDRIIDLKKEIKRQLDIKDKSFAEKIKLLRKWIEKEVDRKGYYVKYAFLINKIEEIFKEEMGK